MLILGNEQPDNSTQNNSLFLFYVNIQTIHKNIDLLNHELLQSFLYLPGTKIKNSILANITLPGFEPIEQADSFTNAGGIGGGHLFVEVSVSERLKNTYEK